jgi:putative tricarboxylic transport membrane protein
MKRTRVGYVAMLLVGTLVLAVDGWPATPKFPDKPLEIIVQSVAGSPSDIFSRLIAKMFMQQKLVSVPIIINNKAGGAGAIANNYLRSKEGNPYYLLHCGGTFISAPLRDPTVPGFKDFTPIARLTVEPISMLVRADSPYKNVKDLVDKAKKGKPGAINVATTSAGGTQHLVVVNLEEVTGAKFNIVSFVATSETTAAALGGHVEVGFLQPALAMPLVEAGRMRILAVSSEKRLSCAPDAPTFREQGFDVVFNSHRGFMAAGKIPANTKKSLSGIFEKVSQSKELNNHVSHEGNELAFLPDDEYKKWLESETAMWSRLMKRAGIIQ